jgi:site-specific DNA recombinase
MSSDTRSRLLASIAAARRWLDDLVTGRAADIEALAARERRSARSVTMQLSLAFLAPNLVKAIVDSRMPRGAGVTRMMDLPVLWSEQERYWACGNGGSL